MVKPQKARAIQDLILRMAQSGQVRQRITEEQLIGLLQQVEGGQEAQGKITVSAAAAPEGDLAREERIDLKLLLWSSRSRPAVAVHAQKAGARGLGRRLRPLSPARTRTAERGWRCNLRHGTHRRCGV
jgi:hypothetical protein